MKSKNAFKASMLGISAISALFLTTPDFALAHCDTLDGPVVQDARRAMETKDITPVLKWVRAKDEKAVQAAFQRTITSKVKNREATENKFFATLVKIHRAGEGAPFTGLKSAGEVEPVIAEADKALAGGSPDGLVKMVTDSVTQGIRQRYEKVAEALKHKDESVQKGREYVEAYVEYTHYVERLQKDAEGQAAHHGEAVHKKQADQKHEHGH